MELTATTTELVQLALAVVASGLVAGVLAGLFGIGGGAVLVPVFYQLLGYAGVDESIRMHISVATSTAIILPTGLRSFMAHRARGAVDMLLLRGWLFWIPLGVIAGTATAANLSGAGLRAVFAVVALLFALRMIFNRSNWQLANNLPQNPVLAFIGVIIGYISVLMGIGGGVLNNTFMSICGRSMHQAVATSSGVGVLIALPGTIGYIAAGWNRVDLPPGSLGYVNLIGVALVIPLTILAAPIGVRLAHRLSKRTLELLFGLFLLTVAAKFGWSLT